MSEDNICLLEGFRVLDLTDEIGHLCGKILGDLGADVIKIEPPGGDPARNNGPFYHDIPHPEKSLFWFFTNLNKRGITLDIKTIQGRELFLRLLPKADIVVESFEPGFLDGLGLGYHDLSKINPGIILTSITPFGQTGPYAHYKTTDLVGISMGGMARIYGYTDSPPMRFSAPQFYFNGGLQGVLGSMMALYHKEITGEGQQVDVSCQQAVVLTLMMASEIWDILKVNYKGIGPFAMSVRPTPPGPLIRRMVWPCKNGYVILMIGGGAAQGVRISSENLVAWANSEGHLLLLKDYKWLEVNFATIIQEEINRIESLIAEFLMTKTKEELFDYAVKHDIMLAPVMDVRDLIASPQLEARKFWVDVDHPELGEKIAYPGWPIKWTGLPPYRPQRRSPLIGEHNEEIYCQELGFSKQELVLLKTRHII
ncbi:MAG: CoA transferase [Deltaproteobacteria bacterium]|nr:CoA transferase [Deltaproteobacteria bacterium]